MIKTMFGLSAYTLAAAITADRMGRILSVMGEFPEIFRL
jgi:hypothetical protein